MSHVCTIQPYIIKFTPKETCQLTHGSNFYGFDLDHTLIRPKNPKAIFAKGADDWKPMVFGDNKDSLNGLIDIVKMDSTAQIVIFTNQGGVITVPSDSKSCKKFTGKIELMLEHISNMPDGDILLHRIWLYSSTMKPAALFPRSSKKMQKVKKPTKIQTSLPIKSIKKTESGTENDIENIKLKFDLMRKPKTGMVDEFVQDLREHDPFFEVDNVTWKYYCGDAAGRKTDFSDSDKVFAKTLGIDFKIPEDIFQ